MPRAPKETLLKVVDGLIAQAQPLTAAGYGSHQGDGYFAVTTNYPADGSVYAQFDAAVANFIRMLGPLADPWKDDLSGSSYGDVGESARRKFGTLKGIRDVINADLLFSVEDLIHAEFFDDLLSQAEYLISQSYFIAAGVLGRCVLEEFLRKWCDKTNCQIAKPESKRTIEDYKSALYAAQHIDKLQMKSIESLGATSKSC